MTEDSQTPQIIRTSDGSVTLKHPVHGEAYHSFAGAATEAKDLYIKSSGILEAMLEPRDSPLEVLDVGLGLGYNALCTIDAWLGSGDAKDLTVTSVEHDGSLLARLFSGAAEWQENWSSPWRTIANEPEQIAENIWSAEFRHPQSGATLSWTIHCLDLREQDPPPARSNAGYDFIWQDPFSPRMNPDLWTSDWFHRLAETCAKGATLMTYSVARPVKDSLQAAGWTYTLIPTTTAKRAWLKASRN